MSLPTDAQLRDACYTVAGLLVMAAVIALVVFG